MSKIQKHRSSEEDHHIWVIGGSASGLIFSYYALQQAQQDQKTINIHIVDAQDHPASRNMDHGEDARLSPAASSGGLAASYTWCEALTVADFGSSADFKAALSVDAKDYGLRVEGVETNTPYTKAMFAFFDHTTPEQKQAAYNVMAGAGKRSMQLWDELYESDPALARILDDAGYESGQKNLKLHIIHKSKHANPTAFAASSVALYNQVMHEHPDAKIMTPDDVVAHDPSLARFVADNSVPDKAGQRVWNDDIAVTAAHGGGIIPEIFYPKFLAYIQEKARSQGSYVEFKGRTKLTDIAFDDQAHNATNLNLKGAFNQQVVLAPEDQVVVASGGNYHLAQALGLDHPEMGGFAGASLVLDFTPEMVTAFEREHGTLPKKAMVPYFGMNVSFKPVLEPNGALHIGVGGIKSFYGDKRPDLSQDFVQWAVAEHLRTLNKIYPHVVAYLLGEDIQTEDITYAHVKQLVNQGYAREWTGSRPIAYDFLPVIGQADRQGKALRNVFLYTAMGSGGIAYGPAAGKTAALVANGSDFKNEPALHRFSATCRPQRG